MPCTDLDLLYYVGHAQNDASLIAIATQHANSIINEILRPDYSSYHLVNFSPQTGLPQAKMTNQGWKDDSTWSRGQAWAILGFAQTYTWTKEPKFLETAIKCAQNFLHRLEQGKGKWHHYMVPVWDFDAPQDDATHPLRDVSAGVITANGLFIIHQALQALPGSTAHQLSSGIDFLDTAMQIVGQTLEMSYDTDFASFKAPAKKVLTNGNAVNGAVVAADFAIEHTRFECILRNSTTNWNEHAHQKYKDHGLVYADYYLMEFGNKLLRAGLV